ncbi:methyl-accepting chemotaxis protein [Anoxybacillus kamchatkensis]|uniref:methyl-accepting chemotaxis protein n=1 Tax=Anoxybacillus ayderensis TaxID=265546 RepID=UPI0015EB5473|nr:methyl-accepting chemotaxis protein [Anoxybacillus ayderensis]MBA2877346.1 methyl-accepting chemotaxis protein [Anoxybacillus ayderensis]
MFKLKSLQTKMIVSFSFIFLVCGLLLGFLVYRSADQFVVQSVGTQARHIVENAAKLIDMDQYKTIRPETGKNDYYHELRAIFSSMREMNNLKYLYTMNRRTVEDGYEYYYVVDGSEGEDFADLGEVEVEINDFPMLIKAFETKTPQVGELSYSETYGALVSAYVPLIDESGEIVGVLGADFDATSIYELMKENEKKMLFLTISMLLVVILMVFLLTLYLVKPLKQLTKSVYQLREGKFDVTFEVNRSDEIGELANAFAYTVHELRTIIDGVTRTSVDLNESAGQMLKRTEEAAHRIECVSEDIDRISSETNQQQAYIERISLTIDEMSRALQSIASSLDETVHASQHISHLSQKGKEKMEGSTYQMKKISEKQQISVQLVQELENKSKEIHQIVELISQIAAQTNLLALNAAIEAARAGEHGKGFAVVSEEVRKLAEQSSEAASTIAGLIEDILVKMERAVKAMNESTQEIYSGTSVLAETGASFYEIIQEVARVSDQIESISAATEQLSSSSEQVVDASRAVQAIAKRTASSMTTFAGEMHQQAVFTQQLSDTSKELHHLSHKLQEMIRHLNRRAM